MIYPDGLLRCYMLGHHLRYHQRTLWFLMQPCKLFQRFNHLLQHFLLRSSLVLLKHTLWPLHDILLHGIPMCQTITCVTGSTLYGFSCRLVISLLQLMSTSEWRRILLPTLWPNFSQLHSRLVICHLIRGLQLCYLSSPMLLTLSNVGNIQGALCFFFLISRATF